MADEEEERRPPIGLVLIDGDIVHKHHLGSVQNHYPYTCRFTHCTTKLQACGKLCCKARLESQLQDLSSTFDALRTEQDTLAVAISKLRKEVEDRSAVSFTLSETTNSIMLSGTHLCQNSDDSKKCISCAVEQERRGCSVVKAENALYRLQIETLREYRDLRARDEEQQNIRADESQQEIQETKLSLETLTDEIKQLEGQVAVLKGWESRKNHAFWKTVDALDPTSENMSTMCDCSYCFGEILALYKTTMEKAESYKAQLFEELGIGKGQKSTLQIERERLREQVARDSPYGRTGSYRGFGAGSLKIARHLNSNSNNGQQSKEPVKTAKKPKKPAMGR